MADGRIYMLQPSFATGEISPDVASRVDLDKYQSALLQAKNVFIRPYGSAYRRPGTLHIADLAPGNILLQEFAVDADRAYLLEFGNQYLNVWKDGVKKKILTTPFTGTELRKLRFAQSADVMFIASGTHPIQVLTRLSDTNWTLTDFAATPPYFDKYSMASGVTLTPSATSGTINITASGNTFTAGQVGNWLQLSQEVNSQTVTLQLEIKKNATEPSVTATSASMLAGSKGWKVISHGTWTGNFQVEYSKDNSTWKQLRSYSSKRDYNPTESGTFDEPTYIRVKATLEKDPDNDGSITIDLTRLPYTHKGTARITAYTDAKHVTAAVQDKLAGTMAATDWAYGSWSETYGYPSCVTFFQDRLCLAANNRYPYMVWMSRTADYYNFGTEEAEGTLTDDSAVAISFISRRDYRIKHLVAQSDLLILTEGNEWIISGSSTVKPTDVNPQVQTGRGTTDVIPVLVGGQMIYVQRHGKTVRDLQYNYASDSYDGADLTILAKHITKGTYIVDATYKQEPDYMIFFVLADGTCACLTYIHEQKVYAWSRIVTDGTIKAVEAVTTPDDEDIYLVVERGGNNYLERLPEMADTDVPDDYVMLDCAKQGTNGTPGNIITAAWLANRTVDVLADGCHIRDLEADASGNVTLDVPCTRYVIGLPYTSVMELPNIEMQLNDGTMQGRKKKVSAVILRLSQSLGGRVGIKENKTDVIKYDELMAQEVTLFSGEKNVTVPNVTVGGFNDWGRIVVVSSTPYPLSVASVVRAVVSGG